MSKQADFRGATKTRRPGLLVKLIGIAVSAAFVTGLVVGASRLGPEPDAAAAQSGAAKRTNAAVAERLMNQQRSAAAAAGIDLDAAMAAAAQASAGHSQQVGDGAGAHSHGDPSAVDPQLTKLDPAYKGLLDHAPAFLLDDESYADQRAQIDTYLESAPAGAVWRTHIAPALEAWSPGAASVPASETYSAAELESFRDQLIDFSYDLEELLALFPRDLVYDTAARQADYRELVEDLPVDDLAVIKDAAVEYPGFWSTPEYILGLLQTGPTQYGGFDPVPVVPLPPGIDLPFPPGGAGLDEGPVTRPTVPSDDVTIPQRDSCEDSEETCADGCPDPIAGGAVTVFALKGAELAADGFCSFLDADFFLVSVEIPNIAKLICLGIADAINLSRVAVEGAHEVYKECEVAYHWGLVHALLDDTVSSRASQVSFDFYDTVRLRLAIEENLLDSLDHRIALFQLPEAQGGYLDTVVRFAVRDAIDITVAAGHGVGNAEDEYDAAEAELAAGEYKEAYARYRKAYRAAVAIGR